MQIVLLSWPETGDWPSSFLPTGRAPSGDPSVTLRRVEAVIPDVALLSSDNSRPNRHWRQTLYRFERAVEKLAAWDDGDDHKTRVGASARLLMQTSRLEATPVGGSLLAMYVGDNTSMEEDAIKFCRHTGTIKML